MGLHQNCLKFLFHKHLLYPTEHEPEIEGFLISHERDTVSHCLYLEILILVETDFLSHSSSQNKLLYFSITCSFCIIFSNISILTLIYSDLCIYVYSCLCSSLKYSFYNYVYTSNYYFSLTKSTGV